MTTISLHAADPLMGDCQALTPGPSGYRYRVTSGEERVGPAAISQVPRADRLRRSPMAAFSAGAAVGLLGGMIGLGGAEFRLPLLIGLFGFVALQAVIVNKAMSLAVVLTRYRRGWLRCPTAS